MLTFAEKDILGAINVPNEAIRDDVILELPKDDQQILVYCQSGNRSTQALQKLADIDYMNVY